MTIDRAVRLSVVFVRHGESEANVGDFINDDPTHPVALTARGIEQADATRRELAGIAFCRAYASEFLRARQTAERILAGRAVDLLIDARLNERRSGMDGQPTAAFNDWIRADPVHRKPPMGESFLEQMARLQGFLSHLVSLDLAGTVLAVSHENPILAVQAIAGALPEVAVRRHVANGASVVVDWTGGRWQTRQETLFC
jgi:broad specificity phosphatase PhoE